MPLKGAGEISKQLVARASDSLKRRTDKEAQFQGEDTFDEEDAELLEEELASEEVSSGSEEHSRGMFTLRRVDA